MTGSHRPRLSARRAGGRGTGAEEGRLTRPPRASRAAGLFVGRVNGAEPYRAAHHLAGRGAGDRGSIFLRPAAWRPRSASVQRRAAFRTGVASRRQRRDDIDGVHGVRFAVWAPNARAVSVVGDFNTWDPRRNPMRLRFPAGVWELFIPRLAPARATSTPSRARRLATAAESRPAGACDRVAAGHSVGRCRSGTSCLARQAWMRQRARRHDDRRAHLDL